MLIAVRAYSAMHRGWRDVATRDTIDWPVERTLLEFSKNATCGAVLFLFDADAGAGRFLRLDGLSIPPGRSKNVTCSLPRENAITTENLEQLVRSLGRRPAA